MIRHVVVFRFRPDIAEGDRVQVLAELQALPQRFAAMRRFALGKNISRRDDTFSYGFSVEFDTEDELLAYLDSEEHERFVRERFRPAVERRAIVSFVADGTGSDALA